MKEPKGGIGLLIGLGRPKRPGPEATERDDSSVERRIAAKKLMRALDAKDPAAVADAFEALAACCDGMSSPGDDDDDDDEEEVEEDDD